MKNLSVQFNANSGEHHCRIFAQGVSENYFDKVELLLEMIDETLQQAVVGFKKEDQLNGVTSGLIFTMNHYRQQLIDLKALLQGPQSELWPEIKEEANLLIGKVYKAISLL